MVHLRLRAETVAVLKRRAIVAELPPVDYVELVLWYSVLEWGRSEGAAPAATEEELYFSAPLPARLRAHMAMQSAAQARNLSVYAGELVEEFLRRFERDPQDFQLVARLSELLERHPVPAEQEVQEVLRLAANGPVSRMPKTYQARWLHRRLSPYVPQIEADGAITDLTFERISSLLARLEPVG